MYNLIDAAVDQKTNLQVWTGEKDPGFVNIKGTTAADFALTKDSPAVNAGTVIDGYRADFLGHAVPDPGRTPDVGAFEYGPPATVDEGGGNGGGPTRAGGSTAVGGGSGGKAFGGSSNSGGGLVTGGKAGTNTSSVTGGTGNTVGGGPTGAGGNSGDGTIAGARAAPAARVAERQQAATQERAGTPMAPMAPRRPVTRASPKRTAEGVTATRPAQWTSPVWPVVSCRGPTRTGWGSSRGSLHARGSRPGDDAHRSGWGASRCQAARARL